MLKNNLKTNKQDSPKRSSGKQDSYKKDLGKQGLGKQGLGKQGSSNQGLARSEGEKNLPKNRILEARGIWKSYRKLNVLQDLSLQVRAGESVGLIGPNGAGKTTFFYILAGLISADKGKVFLNGKDISSFSSEKRAELRITYIPQETSLFQGLSAEDNLKAILELHHPKRARKERLDELLADFSLTEIRNRKAQLLSGGEKQRLEIARALCCNPQFMLLDEPLAGVDPIAVSEIEAMITKLKKKKIGILISDHNIYELLKFVDKTYVMYKGALIATGAPKQIAKNPLVRQYYLGKRFRL